MATKLETLLQQSLPLPVVINMVALAAALIAACTLVTTVKYNLRLVTHRVDSIAIDALAGAGGETPLAAMQALLQTEPPPRTAFWWSLCDRPVIGRPVRWARRVADRVASGRSTNPTRTIAVLLCPNVVIVRLPSLSVGQSTVCQTNQCRHWPIPWPIPFHGQSMSVGQLIVCQTLLFLSQVIETLLANTLPASCPVISPCPLASARPVCVAEPACF